MFAAAQNEAEAPEKEAKDKHQKLWEGMISNVSMYTIEIIGSRIKGISAEVNRLH